MENHFKLRLICSTYLMAQIANQLLLAYLSLFFLTYINVMVALILELATNCIQGNLNDDQFKNALD